MPTVRIPRPGEFRVFFYSADGVEAPHVHVQKGRSEKGRSEIKFWVTPDGVRVARVVKMSEHDQARAKKLIADNTGLILEAWNAFFAR